METMLVVTAFIGIIYIISLFVAHWKIFEKAGEKGWKVFIPFYNAFVYGKIAGGVKLGYALLCVAIVYAFIAFVGIFKPYTEAQLKLAICTNLVAFLLLCIVASFLIGARFGRSAGFRILLCLPYISIIAYLYLAFSKECVYSTKPHAVSDGGLSAFIFASMAIFAVVALGGYYKYEQEIKNLHYQEPLDIMKDYYNTIPRSY